MKKRTAGIIALVIGVYIFSSTILLAYYLLSKKEPPNFVKGYSELLLFSDLSCRSLTWEQVKSSSSFQNSFFLVYTLLGIFFLFFGLRAIFSSEIDKNLIKKLQNKIEKDKFIRH